MAQPSMRSASGASTRARLTATIIHGSGGETFLVGPPTPGRRRRSGSYSPSRQRTRASDSARRRTGGHRRPRRPRTCCGAPPSGASGTERRRRTREATPRGRAPRARAPASKTGRGTSRASAGSVLPGSCVRTHCPARPSPGRGPTPKARSRCRCRRRVRRGRANRPASGRPGASPRATPLRRGGRGAKARSSYRKTKNEDRHNT
mmetsp:Transcript_2798/g.9359  ORF Transcript_2798/g.9359 Transcript_2798/m.9359 type:complete len:205 (+) Transcript_2798:401-1015(+)